MGGKYLGIDIEDRFLKLVVMNGSKVTRTIVEVMPDNIVIGGRLVAFHALGDYLHEVVKKNRIRVKRTAIALPSESYYIRRIRLPRMTSQQLLINIPYEFRDYLPNEPDQYVYDYSVLSVDEQEMELLVAALSKEQVADYKMLCKRAGLTLAKLVPDVLAIQQIVLPPEDSSERRKRMAAEEKEKARTQRQGEKAAAKERREHEKDKRSGRMSVEELSERAAEEARSRGVELTAPAQNSGSDTAAGADGVGGSVAGNDRKENTAQIAGDSPRSRDYAILDIEYGKIRLHFFSNGAYEITRNLTSSEKHICEIIAQEKGVDVHIAQLMLDGNQSNIMGEEYVSDQLQTLATEIMRVMNFYNYNNPKNNIDSLYYYGRAAHPQLAEHIESAVELNLHPLTELLPEGVSAAEDDDQLIMMLQGYGAVME